MRASIPLAILENSRVQYTFDAVLIPQGINISVLFPGVNGLILPTTLPPQLLFYSLTFRHFLHPKVEKEGHKKYKSPSYCLQPIFVSKLANKATPVLLHRRALHDLHHQLHGLLGGDRTRKITVVILAVFHETCDHGTVFLHLLCGC